MIQIEEDARSHCPDCNPVKIPLNGTVMYSSFTPVRLASSSSMSTSKPTSFPSRMNSHGTFSLFKPTFSTPASAGAGAASVGATGGACVGGRG